MTTPSDWWAGITPPRCIHASGGEVLCPDCLDDYEADPEAWLEFGSHEAGLAAWDELQREIQAAQDEARREEAAQQANGMLLWSDDNIPW